MNWNRCVELAYPGHRFHSLFTPPYNTTEYVSVEAPYFGKFIGNQMELIEKSDLCRLALQSAACEEQDRTMIMSWILGAKDETEEETE